jgi:hypothetical protein
MARWRRLAIAAVGFLSAVLPAFAQCGLAVVPAAETRWYRSDGWAIPGLEDAKFRPLHQMVDGKQKDSHWANGITVSAYMPDDNHRQLTIPGAVFDESGSSKKLLEQSAYLYWIFRWEVQGKPYAYSYNVGSTRIACSFTFDLVDDRGDGKFRLLISPGNSVMNRLPGSDPEPPPLPTWATNPSS